MIRHFRNPRCVGPRLGLDAVAIYWTTGWKNRVRFLAEAGNFFSRRLQTDSGAHQASYPVGRGGSFYWGKAAGA